MSIEDYINRFNGKFNNYHTSQLDPDDFEAVWEGVFKELLETQLFDLLAIAKRRNNTLIVDTVARRIAQVIESDATPAELRDRFGLPNDL